LKNSKNKRKTVRINLFLDDSNQFNNLTSFLKANVLKIIGVEQNAKEKAMKNQKQPNTSSFTIIALKLAIKNDNVTILIKEDSSILLISSGPGAEAKSLKIALS